MGRPAKYVGIAAQLERRIRDGALGAGAPLPSETVLAGEFGVNRLTLRKAVDVLISDGLVVRQPGRGTFVQQPRPGARTVVYVGSTQDHFYQTLHAALCAEGQDRGCAVTALTPRGDDDDRRRLEAQLAQAVAAICVIEASRHLLDLVPEHVPVVRVTGFQSIVEGHQHGRDGYIVSTDTYRAAKLAVEHLTALGHRRIALMDAGSRVSTGGLHCRPRADSSPYLGYRSALREAEIEPELVLAVPELPLDAWPEADYQIARRFLEQCDVLPTACVCVGDFRAAPLLRAATDLGLRVPEDLSIVGMGNTPWARWLAPPLTSVALGEEQMARLAILLSDEALPGRPTVVRVDPHLVIRNSTSPAKE